MKMLFKIFALLTIALSISSPSALSMIGTGARREEQKQKSTLRNRVILDHTAAVLGKTEENSGGREFRSDSNLERETVVSRGEKSFEIEIEREKSSLGKKSWPVKMKSPLSVTDLALLEQDLEKTSLKELPYEYSAASWKPSEPDQKILDRWSAKGVIVDFTFVANANAIRKDSEKKTEEAKKLELIAEKIFNTLEEEQHYAAAIYYSNEFIHAADQVTDAWKKTAEMHQQIPGRQWGVRLKDRWAMKLDEWRERREKIEEDFLEQIENINKEAVDSIKKFQEKCDIFKEEKKYNNMACLSGAYGNILRAQRTLPASLPKGALSISTAIKLELGFESLKAAMIEAELKYQTIMGSGGSKSDVEERTPNKSISTSGASSQEKLSAEEREAEEKNRAFQQRAAALESYAAKTLETVYDCFSFFTSGGEFADETDTNDLAAAYDTVETAAWVLNALKIKTASGKQDSWLQQEKEDMAVADLEEAIEAAHTIAARIGNEKVYERDKNTDRILTTLQKAKEEYAKAR